MLKFLFILIFIIPICFLKKNYWMVQNFIFLITFLFVCNNFYSSYRISLRYFIGVDLISYGLILLRLWICSLILIARESINRYNNYKNFFSFVVLILLIFLVLTFSVTSLFIFYLFFERRLIPTLFLILGWGYQPERLQAGVYLLFYTLLASIPILVGIFFVYNNYLTINIYILSSYNITSILLYLRLIFAFLVKIPIFLVHL